MTKADELLKEVVSYYEGTGKYEDIYSDNDVIDAWNELYQQIKAYLKGIDE